MSIAVNLTPQTSATASASAATVVPLLAPAGARGKRREERLAEALSHAQALGITAVWTADHSASVELSRLAGPVEHELGEAEAAFFGLRPGCPRQLGLGPVRCAVYERVLSTGTPFDIYRWVNLLDLAVVWPVMYLPRGVRDEWQRALHAAQLA